MPESKPLQENLTFFQVRASRYPLHLSQQIMGLFNIPIPEGRLLLSCLWKVGLILQSKTGNQLSYRDDMVCTELSSKCRTEIDVPLVLRRASQGIPGVS